MKLKKLTILFCILLTGCAVQTQRDGAPSRYVDVSKIPNAVPRVESKSKYGNQRSYVVNGRVYHVLPTANGYHARGIASWYGTKFHDRLTSNRERYDMYAMTAASRVLPLPTYVKVTNLENGRSVIVRVNDRGPFEKNRILDLSYVAAAKLGMMRKGTAYVDVRAISPATYLHRPNYVPVDTAIPSTPVLTHPHIYLQVGAFTDIQNANTLKVRLQLLLSEPVRVVPPKNHERAYKVQVGPLANVTVADQVFDNLVQSGYAEPMTVIE